MKKVLASLLAIYVATNAQTAAPGTGTAAGAAASTAAATTVAPVTIGAAPVIATNQASTTTTVAPAVVAPATIGAQPGTPAAGAAASTTAAPTTPAPSTPAPSTTTTSGNPINVVIPGLGEPAPGTGTGTGSTGGAAVTPQTPTPTTPAPTFNPYSPLPNALIAAGLQRQRPGSPDAGCLYPTDMAYDFNGILKCNANYACAQCMEVRCGDPMGIPCQDLVISDSGAVGNQNIKVLGSPELNNNIFGGNMQIGGGWGNNGAEIRCNGLEACKASRIEGKYVGQMSCSGDFGCQGANIILTDPVEQLQVQCNGMMSCMNTNLEIILTQQSVAFELQTIEFNGQQSAQGMTITIRNEAFSPVLLQNLECMNPTACPGLRIQIIGQVFIENCDLQHMNQNLATPSLLAACQAGNAFNQGGFIPGGFPQQMPPQQQFPGQISPVAPQPQPNPAPVTPVNPVAPAPPQQVNPVAPVQPVAPQTPGFGAAPGFGFGAQELNCEFGQCRGRAITLQTWGNFQLKCQQMGQCDGLQLTLNAAGGQIDTLTFSVPTNGVTVTINGYVELGDIRCEVPGACTNLKITAPGIIDYTQMNMDCQQFGACNGCTVNGQSCDMLSMSNNQGFYYPPQQFGGFGQPQVPQQQPAPYNPFQYGYPQWI